MTGPEHYREAEGCLEAAAENHEYDNGTEIYWLVKAQAHATLALAAATALANYCGDRMTEGDARGWYVAASAHPEHARQQREAERAEMAALAEEGQA